MSESAEAIRNLVFRYAELNDLGDWEGIGDLLAHAELTRNRGGVPSAVSRGREEVVAFYRTHVLVYDGQPRTRHLITNLIVDVDEAAGTARTRSYFTVLQCLPDFPLQIVASGRYHDEFENRDGRWRFSRKTIHADYAGDLGRHATRAN